MKIAKSSRLYKFYLPAWSVWYGSIYGNEPFEDPIDIGRCQFVCEIVLGYFIFCFLIGASVLNSIYTAVVFFVVNPSGAIRMIFKR